MTQVKRQMHGIMAKDIDDATFNKDFKRKSTLLIYCFPSNLMLQTLDTKRLRTWKIDGNPLRLLEALLTSTSQTQIAALTRLNITLLCTTSYWQTSLDSGLLALASPAAVLSVFYQATVLVQPLIKKTPPGCYPASRGVNAPLRPVPLSYRVLHLCDKQISFC